MCILHRKIDKAFFQGMHLEPQEYLLEVSCDGFETKKSWINLEAGEVKEVNVSLIKKRPTENEIPEALMKEFESERVRLGIEKLQLELARQQIEETKSEVEKLITALREQKADLEMNKNKQEPDTVKSSPKDQAMTTVQTKSTGNAVSSRTKI